MIAELSIVEPQAEVEQDRYALTYDVLWMLYDAGHSNM